MSIPVYTGCNVCVIRNGHRQAHFYRADSHWVDVCYVFNINPRSEALDINALGGKLDYVLFLKADIDYFWFSTSPNIIVLNQSCVMEVSDRAREGLDLVQDTYSTDGVEWENIMHKLGFELDEDECWVPKGGRKEKPDVHPSASQFVDEDPEPF